MTAKPAAAHRPPPGGGFLLAPPGSAPVRTPAGFTDEQREFYRTARKFAVGRVLASAERIEEKDFAVIRGLVREAGELGLLCVDLPEDLGGLAQDETTSMLVTDAMTVLGAWNVIFGAQTGIGTLPIAWFGTEEQKRKYLPRLASGEWVSAYALSEPSSGSDALAARTRAVLSPDGKHWILDGTKQWISNAGFADLFVVFAKVDGEHFSAFLVERGTPGFAVGREERKMGIRGSSTCPLTFEEARLPREALLGEVGKGHRIAFNILNVGRLKLGVGCVAGIRRAIAETVPYAKERKAFGRPIADFGLVREKLARMAALVYVGEALGYRTAGLVDARVEASGARRGGADFDREVIAAAEEYAIEASILKVWGSEALFQAVDEAVQIHGGYGFVEEYAVERMYRDNRVNRIFEGTNEINRMLVPNTLLRRAARGQFPLLDLARGVREAVARGELPRAPAGRLGREVRAAELSKWLFAYAAQTAFEAFGEGLAERQEVLGSLADVAIEAYAVDSAVARALAEPDSAVGDACVRLYALEAHERAWSRARRAVLCSARDAGAARAHLAALRALLDDEPCDPTAWRETIVEAALEKGRYPLEWA